MPTVRVENVDEAIADLQRRGLVAPDGRRQPEAPVIAQAEPVKVKVPKQQRPIGPAVYTFSVFIPGVVLKSETNIGGQLRVRLSRKAMVKQAMREALTGVTIPFTEYPLRITLTRLGGGAPLDRGNFETCFKAVQDMVSEHFGFDDGDRRKVRWRFKQSASWEAGIRVEVRG